MFQHWCKAVSEEVIGNINGNFGKNIFFYKENNSDEMPSGCRIAIVGIEERLANDIRQQLYCYESNIKHSFVTDLGNIKKNDIDFLIPLLREIMQSGMIPLIIGGQQKHLLAQVKAFMGHKKNVAICMVDAYLRYFLEDEKNAYLNSLLDISNLITQCSVLATQSHVVNRAVLDVLEDKNFEMVRLGKIHAQIDLTEPFVREADSFSFEIASIRQADAPNQIAALASGLSVEEACQLCRYAGMSDKLSAAGIYGFEYLKNDDNLTAKTVAQLLWYFVDGVANRTNDYPVSLEQMTEYVVSGKDDAQEFIFWKSNKSGRWWIQVDNRDKNSAKNKLVACAFQDYQAAIQGELPERLWKAML